MQPTHRKSNDLFFTTLEQLHGPAPIDLLNTLRAQLKIIQQTNPNSAQTAEACLDGLVSDRSTLLHVLTAAYLINGGVMLKHQLSAVNEDDDPEDSKITRKDLDSDFGDLEEELDTFSLSMSAELKHSELKHSELKHCPQNQPHHPSHPHPSEASPPQSQ